MTEVQDRAAENRKKRAADQHQKAVHQEAVLLQKAPHHQVRN